MIDPEAITEAKRALGRQLAACRDAAGLNQHQLAPLIHFGRSTIANAETGHSICSRTFWERCDRALQADGALLRGYDDLQALVGTQRAQIAELAEAKRVAKFREVQGQQGVAMPALSHTLVRQPASGQLFRSSVENQGDVGDGWEYAMKRRAFLAGGLSATTLPALNLDDLYRLVAALDDARRYLDGGVVEYLRGQLAACAVEDGDRGPKATLPVVLGIVGVVDQNVRLVKPPIRRELLALGARSAEFAGWLYRDIGAPALADYWRDRAMEWAQAGGDAPMQGYILLKKSQSAWDQRNASRMLTLAEATQEGSWGLSPRVSAEAAQQAARGYAMLTSDWAQVERKLGEARGLFAQDPGPPDPGVHDAAPLFELQTAICHHAAGQSHQAVIIYEQQLNPRTFSRRDYGYFLSLKGQALAASGAPDDAADCGLQALSIARATDSIRTRGELDRLIMALRPVINRPKVRELHQALLASC